MKKIVIILVLLSFVSCAAVTEYQKVYTGELTERDNKLFGPPASQSSLSTLNDGSSDLLLGLYVYSLIKNPAQYPLLYSPYLFSPLYPFDSFHELMKYQSMLQSINDMEMSKLQMEVQRIIDELRREAAKIKD